MVFGTLCMTDFLGHKCVSAAGISCYENIPKKLIFAETDHFVIKNHILLVVRC